MWPSDKQKYQMCKKELKILDPRMLSNLNSNNSSPQNHFLKTYSRKSVLSTEAISFFLYFFVKFQNQADNIWSYCSSICKRGKWSCLSWNGTVLPISGFLPSIPELEQGFFRVLRMSRSPIRKCIVQSKIYNTVLILYTQFWLFLGEGGWQTVNEKGMQAAGQAVTYIFAPILSHSKFSISL